jgi:hypothetical protein
MKVLFLGVKENINGKASEDEGFEWSG